VNREESTVPDQPSPAELMRSVEATRGDVLGLRHELRQYVADVHQLITRVTVVEHELTASKQGHERDVANVRADIDELREWQTWAIRIVLGVVIAAVIGVALALGDRAA